MKSFYTVSELAKLCKMDTRTVVDVLARLGVSYIKSKGKGSKNYIPVSELRSKWAEFYQSVEIADDLDDLKDYRYEDPDAPDE